MEIGRFRARMPLVAFVMLLVICLLMLGFAGACLGDQTGLALERALQSTALPAVLMVWAVFLPGVFSRVRPRLAVVAHPGRGSPELLQRFLF